MPLPRRRSFRRCLWALLLTAGLAQPAWAAKDELVIGLSQFPATFHPSLESMAATTYVLGMTQRPFTAYDAGWKLICLLCTELPSLENGLAKVEDLGGGKKGVALTYTIQPKATWGDGTPVTTKDVLFTWEVGKAADSGVVAGELYRRILKIDVKDAKTFTLHVDRLGFDYAAINDFRLLPEHVERKAFTATGGEYRNRTVFDTAPTTPGLWFGPYRISEVVRGSHVVLEPNPTWYGAKPSFKRIVVRTIENSASMEANFLSGGVDYVAGELGLPIERALALEAKIKDRAAVVTKPGLIFEHMGPSHEHPALKDKRVRAALLHGLDREQMVAKLFGGRQPVARGEVSPLDWMYDANITTYPYDPARAAALLDEAGWKLGAGGLRRNAAGQPLSVELATTAGNRMRETIQLIAQDAWKRLGIEVRLKAEPPRVFFAETVGRRKAELALFALISSPENVPRSALHSTMIPKAENGWSGQNYGGYRSAEMDRLLDAIEIELDKEKRRGLWQQLQRLWADDLPVLPLFWRADAYVIPHWLKGIVPTGHQGFSTLWVENWRAE